MIELNDIDLEGIWDFSGDCLKCNVPVLRNPVFINLNDLFQVRENNNIETWEWIIHFYEKEWFTNEHLVQLLQVMGIVNLYNQNVAKEKFDSISQNTLACLYAGSRVYVVSENH